MGEIGEGSYQDDHLVSPSGRVSKAVGRSPNVARNPWFQPDITRLAERQSAEKWHWPSWRLCS